jgi:diguanylate cyclase (GGDEF)-like protein/PAS domain S-box-containing protein
MNDGAIFVDTESRILEWNRAAERLTGLHRSAVLHSDWEPGLIGLTDERGHAVQSDQCPIQHALQTGQPATRRLHIQQPTGKRLRVEIQMMPVFDERGTLRGGAMLMGDASEQAGLEEKMLELHAQATQDPLTKVANRAELTRRLQMFVRNAQSTNKPGSVLICDIDFFKRINDTLGHAAGDEALKVFAALLKDLSRTTDLVARYGGEEFVILCDDCDLKSAVQIGETIRQRLQRTPVSALKGKCMTASFGVSQVVDGDKPDDPLERADKGLLQAKQTGRDRVVAVSAHELLNGPSEEKPKNEAKQASSWLSWLGSSSIEPVVKADLLSSVPRGIAIEKLKGFVAESKAEIIDIQPDFVHLRVDCRYAPMTRRDSDRPTVFEMKIELVDVDVAGTGRAGQLQRQTRLAIQILANRQRDRRAEAIVDQANRLRLSIQAYLVAQEIDASIQERLVPVYKPGADGR